MVRCLGCMEEYDEDVAVCPHCGYHTGERAKEAYYLPPGTVLNHQYMVGKVLGYGGFGVTYIGWDLDLNRKVAVKEYLPSDFATRGMGSKSITVFSRDAAEQFRSGLESFLQEARKLAKFNHIPEIVDIYDCFMENDTGYIVMEFLYGQTVKELLSNGKAFSYPTAIKIIRAILTGLENVHREGIIHRDIAPDNIFITMEDEIRLLDFGAARYATTTYSKSLSVILKPGYAPEEQYRSKGEQGPWTDVYGAAATLYRMITGIRPQESIERLMEDHLKAPSNLGIEIPQNVENALMNALNVKKEYRIQTAGEFLQALDSERVKRVVPAPVGDEKVKIPGWSKAVAVGCAVLVAAAGAFLVYQAGVNRNVGQGVQAQMQEGQEYVTDMTGLSYDEAKSRLGDRCKLIISGKNYSTTVEYDKILSQTPTAGEIINIGDEVKVIMSGGTLEVTMPDLESLTKEEAIALVEAQGLAVDEEKSVEESYNDLVEKGRVYAQGIPAGEKVTPGSEVPISISLGRLEDETAVLEVPNLTGMTKKEAENILKTQKKREGFTYPLGDIEKKYDREIPKGQIISQSLEAGTKVRTDKAISLVISQGPEMIEMPDVVYMTKAEAVAALEVHFHVETVNAYSSSVENGKIISQSVEAGEKVEEGSAITLSVSIGEQPVQNTPADGYSNSGFSGGDSGGNSSGGWSVDDGGGGSWKVE